MKFLSFLINRPVACSMMIFVLVFVGAVSFFLLPVNLFPNVSRPVLKVETLLSGAGPYEMEERVTKKLEEELSFVENLVKMTSLSSEEKSEIYLYFRWGTHMEYAALNVREKIDRVLEDLPDDITPPIVERFNPIDKPILILNLTSENNDLTILREHAEKNLKPHLERIEGVASVRVYGGDKEEILVHISPSALKAHNLTLEEVTDALEKENIEESSGLLEEGEVQFLVKVSARFRNIEDIKKVIVATHEGSPIYLESIGRVYIARSPLAEDARLNGSRSLEVALYKNPESNAMHIVEAVKATMKESGNNQSWQHQISYDQSVFIQEAMDFLKGNAIVGSILTLLILFFFLRSFKPTLIIAISIPVSLICTFFLVYLGGMTLNMFSFVGLALAIGIVVDASIVVIESIDYHTKLGKNPKTAAIEGTSEVALAVFASCMTTAVVFLPLLFIRGEVGFIFRDLSLAIIYTLIFSLLVAFTLIPMLSVYMGESKDIVNIDKEEFVEKAIWWKKIFDKFFLNRLWHYYEKILRKFVASSQLHPAAIEARRHVDKLYDATIQKAAQTLDQQKKIYEKFSLVSKEYEKHLGTTLFNFKRQANVVMGFVLVFIFSFFFFPDREFLPESIEKYFEVQLTAAQPLSKDMLEKLVTEIEGKFKHKYISSVLTKRDAQQFNIFFEINKPRKKEQVLKYVSDELQKYTELDYSIHPVSPVLELTGEFLTDSLDIEVSGPDTNVLQREAKEIATLIKDAPTFAYISYPYGKQSSEVVLEFNRRYMAEQGLTIEGVSRYIRSILKGEKVSFLQAEDKQIDLIVLNQEEPVRSLAKLQESVIPTPSKNFVSLGDVVQFKPSQRLAQIEHVEKQRVLKIRAFLKEGISLEKGAAALTNENKTGLLDKYNLPPKYRFRLSDQNKTLNQSFDDLIIALIVAIILMYMILAALFESLLYPFIILLSVPLALIGIVFSLWIADLKLSIIAFFGIIVLMGTIVNNAIILIDYINNLRNMGMDRKQAVTTAAKRRLRPILMTALTTVTGALPLALGIGSGASLYQPLAVIIAGGLFIGTFLTLFFIPIFYCLLDDLKEMLGYYYLRQKHNLLQALKLDS